MWLDIVFLNCAKRDNEEHPSSHRDPKQSSSKKGFLTEDHVSGVKLSHDI